MSKLYIIGIGFRPLDKRAKEIVVNSRVILASNRLFEVFKEYDEFDAVRDKIKVINNVDETIEFIRANFHGIVLLASGDPMFFGIGRRAVREFGKDMVEILPDLSSIQMAFSRIKEPWDDAFLMSLHGGPDPEKRRRLPYTINDIPTLLLRHNKLVILTDRENNPSEIAKILDLSPIAHSLLPIMYVCERLGYPDEMIISGSPSEIANMAFREPNVVIIKKAEEITQNTEIRFGLKENEISHSKGLITKDEVRAVAIHKLRLPQKGIFWDIGAGSGSVSIEVARLYPELKIFAIEKDTEQIEHIKKNKIRFDAKNVEVINADAPEIFTKLPLPDRVFIGGSGGKLKEIIDYTKQVEIIVIPATTIETLNDAIQCLENSGYNVDISGISIWRSKTIANKKHMSALNPIFIIKGQR